MSALGFKAKVDSVACMFHCLPTMNSSDSPLVRHLLTSWQPTWQPSRFIHVLASISTYINHILKPFDPGLVPTDPIHCEYTIRLNLRGRPLMPQGVKQWSLNNHELIVINRDEINGACCARSVWSLCGFETKAIFTGTECEGRTGLVGGS